MMMPRRNSRRSLPTRAAKASLPKADDDHGDGLPMIQAAVKPATDQDRRRRVRSELPPKKRPQVLSQSPSRGKDASRLQVIHEKLQSIKTENVEEERKGEEGKSQEPSLVTEESNYDAASKKQSNGVGWDGSVSSKAIALDDGPSADRLLAASSAIVNLPSPPADFPSIPTPLPALSNGTLGVATGTETNTPSFAPATGRADVQRAAAAASMMSSWNSSFPFDWNPDLPYHHTPSDMYGYAFGFDAHRDVEMEQSGDEEMSHREESDAKQAALSAVASRPRETLQGEDREPSSDVLWTPRDHFGAVVLSLVDGTPLALLESVDVDVSELFRSGAIHATTPVKSAKHGPTSSATPTTPAQFQPGRKYLRWTDEEDDVLRQAVDGQGPPPINWKRISRKFFRGMRTSMQCKNRWKKVLMPGLRRDPWSKAEDAIVLDGVRKGLKWSDICKSLKGRIPEQVRDHWMNQLDPSIKRDPWTEEEVEILFRRQAQMGNKWCEIAKCLPGRSENAVKNRWHNAKVAQRRKMKKLAKEAEMAQRLKEARSQGELTEQEEAAMAKMKSHLVTEVPTEAEIAMFKTESLKTAVAASNDDDDIICEI